MGSTLYSKRQYFGKKRPVIRNPRKKREKSFKTEEKAKEYAAKLGLKKFEITRLNKTKFRVDNL